MKKILLGILIGLGLTLSYLSIADNSSRSNHSMLLSCPAGQHVYNIEQTCGRDGVCHISRVDCS